MNYIIRDTKEYIKWLDDNLWLNDVIVEDIQFTPNNLTQSKTPQKIKLKCYLQVSGSYQAGEFRTIRKYDISFNDIKEYSLNGKFIKDNCCEGVEDFDSEKGIVFNLFVPGNLLIICNNIEIINQRDEQEIVSSWLSESDFTAEIEGTKLPTPKMWIDYLKKKNLDVV